MKTSVVVLACLFVFSTLAIDPCWPNGNPDGTPQGCCKLGPLLRNCGRENDDGSVSVQSNTDSSSTSSLLLQIRSKSASSEKTLTSEAAAPLVVMPSSVSSQIMNAETISLLMTRIRSAFSQAQRSNATVSIMKENEEQVKKNLALGGSSGVISVTLTKSRPTQQVDVSNSQLDNFKGSYTGRFYPKNVIVDVDIVVMFHTMDFCYLRQVIAVTGQSIYFPPSQCTFLNWPDGARDINFKVCAVVDPSDPSAAFMAYKDGSSSQIYKIARVSPSRPFTPIDTGGEGDMGPRCSGSLNEYTFIYGGGFGYSVDPITNKNNALITRGTTVCDHGMDCHTLTKDFIFMSY